MYSLSKKEFDVLAALAEKKETLSQRELAALTGHSLGTVNKTVRALSEACLMEAGALTGAGEEALEPYRVRRIVFMAAGFGERLVPVTLDMPKPLIPVNGQRLIDGMIEAALAAGIEDILIVRGYMSERFDVLKEKYPTVRFAENPRFAEANNILSALVVKEELQNTYICDADLLIRNPKILKKYHYQSNFLGIYSERTDDLCLTVSRSGVILEEKRGGLNCYRIIGISYWTAEDGARLARDMETAAAMPGGLEYYWEQVPLSVLRENYRIMLRPCTDEDIAEIDTLNELCEIDPSYLRYKRGRI